MTLDSTATAGAVRPFSPIRAPRARTLKIGGRIDRYIARLFALSYLTAFLLVIGLFLIMDMAVNLDDYLEVDGGGNSPGALTVLRFYAVQIPFFYLEMSPFVTLIAGLFTAARLSKANEIVAALGAGISARRLLAPVLVGGAVLALGMFALREWATASLAPQVAALKAQLKEGRDQPMYRGIWVKSREGVTVRVRSYLPEGGPRGEPLIQGLSCQIKRDAALEVVAAEQALALEPHADGRWRLLDGHVLKVTETGQERSSAETLEGVTFTPDDVLLFYKAMDNPLELSFAGTRRVLSRRPDDARVRTAMHYHMTFPLAGLVLLLVGLPFLMGQERGRGVERVAIGLFLCVTYFGVDFVARTLGLNGTLGPIHAGWFPIVLFGSLGAVLFGSMRS